VLRPGDHVLLDGGIEFGEELAEAGDADDEVAVLIWVRLGRRPDIGGRRLSPPVDP